MFADQQKAAAKVESNPATAPPVEELHHTRIELDIEGNQRAVIDAKDRIVMRYHYDMLGNRIHQASMEAGERWTLNDVTGKPIRAWDSRGFSRSMTYDELRRPVGLFVTGNGAERLAERIVYGEDQGTASNHRTRVLQVLDAAGVVTSEAYDFKGNLLSNRRELLPDYKGDVDWQLNPAPTDGTFTSSASWDALNRPTAVTTPDKSVYRPTYSEANLLDKVEVSLRGAATATPFITNIDYNAKGQRILIHYGNGAETTYEYDDQTFRLTCLKTTRTPGQNGLASQIFKSAEIVQDLRYTYDPVGNITRIEDAALSTVFHDGQKVVPVCEYAYDAVYRLIEAGGREHIGQTALGFDPPEGNFRDYPFVGLAHPNDLQALRNYAQRYEYDAVGNFNSLQHIANGGGWTRAYTYGEPSLIEPTANQSNRLSSTTIGPTTEVYAYDAHGNMTTMPHLTLMAWDFKDQLRASSGQAVGSGTPETTYYLYDASGQRVRKVTERQNGTRKDERIYLAGFEIYREYDGGGAVALERETLHMMDDKQRIALVETKTHESGSPIPNPQSLIRYQLGNHLGSASLELDKDGGLISYEEYHPYGTTAFQAINAAAEVSLKSYRYTGKERDEETGYSYHGARYYASWLGRWVSCDPTGLRGGMSLFAYGAGNPIRFGDPSGMEPDMSTREKINGAWMAFDSEEGTYVQVSEPEPKLDDVEPLAEENLEEYQPPQGGLQEDTGTAYEPPPPTQGEVNAAHDHSGVTSDTPITPKGEPPMLRVRVLIVKGSMWDKATTEGSEMRSDIARQMKEAERIWGIKIERLKDEVINTQAALPTCSGCQRQTKTTLRINTRKRLRNS